MRRSTAAIGSAAFFVAAPGTFAGLVPWLITGWDFPGWTVPGALGVLLICAAVFWDVTASFVHWDEEPALTRQFGTEYETYRRAVPAWWPRPTPWTPD